MTCYSGGAKGLVLDYASDEGAEMAPLTAETRAKLPAMLTDQRDKPAKK